MQNSNTSVNAPQPNPINQAAVGNCGDGQQMNYKKVIIIVP